MYIDRNYIFDYLTASYVAHTKNRFETNTKIAERVYLSPNILMSISTLLPGILTHRQPQVQTHTQFTYYDYTVLLWLSCSAMLSKKR